MKHEPRTKSDVQITKSPFVIDDDNDIYADTIYKQYKATIRRSKKAYNLRILITKINPVFQRENQASNLYTKNY